MLSNICANLEPSLAQNQLRLTTVLLLEGFRRTVFPPRASSGEWRERSLRESNVCCVEG